MTLAIGTIPLLSIDPAVGAIIGAIVLSELLTGLQWLAVTLVVSASIGMVPTSKRVGIP